VLNVHDFHLWMITPQIVALAAHVQVEDKAANEGIFAELEARLRDLGIDHTTLQLEGRDCAHGETFCHLPQSPEHDSHSH
jgi:cobalt-zinc-cadmium efflux system protein